MALYRITSDSTGPLCVVFRADSTSEALARFCEKYNVPASSVRVVDCGAA